VCGEIERDAGPFSNSDGVGLEAGLVREEEAERSEDGATRTHSELGANDPRSRAIQYAH
jgi:hypothetical protein